MVLYTDCLRTRETAQPIAGKKKRPRLFSPGRLGSPPPELPNHEMDISEVLILCKRHFGNEDFLRLGRVLNWNGQVNEGLKLNLGSMLVAALRAARFKSSRALK